MTIIAPSLASIYSALNWFVSTYDVHPILVNFTAALVPTSVGMDLIGRCSRRTSLRDTGFWTLALAAVVTPFTAIAGWFFWMDDDVSKPASHLFGASNMEIHKWLGTGLAVVIAALFVARFVTFRRQRFAGIAYLAVGVVSVALLGLQGHLGGQQSFGGMSDVSSSAPSTMNEMPGMTMPAGNTAPGTHSSAATQADDATPARGNP